MRRSRPTTTIRRRREVELLEPRLALAAEPVIHEFLAENDSGLADEDGEQSDWIELYNAGDASVDLAGWHLTDEAANLAKWSLPSHILGAGEFLLVWASGKDRLGTGPNGELHTNFRLDQAGEYLALVAPNNSIATEFAPTFPPQRADYSYGHGQGISAAPLIATGASATVHIPTSATLGHTWTGSAATEPFDDSAAALWIAASTGVGYEASAAANDFTETQGEPIVARSQLDAVTGSMHILSTAFTEPASLSTWSFYSTTTREVTPIIVQDNGLGGYVLRGIGQSRTSSGAGAQQFAFNLQSGSATVGPGYYFGWFDGSPAASGPVTVLDAGFEQTSVAFFVGMPAELPWDVDSGASGIQNLTNSGFSSLFNADVRTAQRNVAYANSGTFTQTLAQSAQPGTYTLSVKVGSRADFPWTTLPADPIVQLLAGSTAVSGSLVRPDPATQFFSTWTLTATIPAGSPLIGQPLRIRLGTTGTSANQGQPNFDDVSLSFAAASGGPVAGAIPYDEGGAQVRLLGTFTSFAVGQTLAAGTLQSRSYSIAATSVRPSPLSPVGYWNFDDASNPNVALDASGNNRHGTIVGAQYTAPATGHSGQPSDRALNFGEHGDGRYVDITSAANGAFDALTAADAATISLWVYGDLDQPTPDTVFYASSSADGTGTRTMNAHLPWSDSTIYWDTGNGDDCCSGAGRISVNEPDSTKWEGRWNHYAFVKNGDTKEIWQNGLRIATGENTYNLATIRSFLIGVGFGKNQWDYGGLIDDVAVWATGLAPQYIQSLALGASPLSLLSYTPLLGAGAAALQAAMQNQNASAYTRIEFDAATALDADALLLKIKYDDGFVAYLNGVEVARRNAPTSVSFNSAAATDRPKIAGLSYEEISLTGAASLLRSGTNILAIHGLNDSVSSGDFLLLPELWAISDLGLRYFSPPTPGGVNGAGVADFVADTSFSVDRGLFSTAFDVVVTTPTVGATIIYTTDGSEPSPTNGTQVPAANANTAPSATIHISTTTTLRVAAFKTGLEPTNVDTQTYLFPAHVANQPVLPPGLPSSFPGGFPADYQVDPDVTNNTLPGYGLVDALSAIPVVSIATARDGLFSAGTGIYANPQATGVGWERAASVEIIYPNGGPTYQVDAGLRIHGGISRQKTFTPKHGLRLFFRDEYGDGKWQVPLFDDYDVEEFDQLVLKGLSTDTWPVTEWGPNAEGFVRWTRQEASYHRDQWIRDTQIALGNNAANGRFVHVFLDGLYWGLYNLMERPTDGFQASHYGGDEDEYDVIHDFAEVQAGDLTAWNAMMSLASAGFATDAALQRIQGNNPDGTRNPAYENYLDVENLIDYMIVHIYGGGDDWPDHNWWAGRRRGPESEGFRFFAWDQEITNNSLVRTRNSWASLPYAQVNTFNTPAYLYDRLRQNATFRRQFGDRVHELMFNGGAMTTAENIARWNERTAEIDKAIVAESARWGDFQRATPYKREVEWLANENWMTGTYWPQIHSIALARFRSVSLYPSIEAPLFRVNGSAQHGGPIAPGAALSLALPTGATAGTIYYTLDGSDPIASGTVYSGTPIALGQSTLVQTRQRVGSEWSALTSAVFSVPSPLRITELHYNPPGGSDATEFIELHNTSATTAIDLAGFKFTRDTTSGDGIEYEFQPGDANLSLAPGEYRVVVRDRAAFFDAYPNVPLNRIADREFAGSLANEGEQLELVDALGGLVQRFTYDDAWHLATDGDGPSLVIVDPLANLADWSTAAAWRPSFEIGGSPGSPDTLRGDLDGNLRVDLVDIAILQAHLGTTTGALAEQGDLNDDGAIDRTDARLFAANFGRGYVQAEASASAAIAATTRTNDLSNITARRRPRPPAVDAMLSAETTSTAHSQPLRATRIRRGG